MLLVLVSNSLLMFFKYDFNLRNRDVVFSLYLITLLSEVSSYFLLFLDNFALSPGMIYSIF